MWINDFLTAEVLEARRNIYGEPQEADNYAEDLINNGELAIPENLNIGILAYLENQN